MAPLAREIKALTQILSDPLNEEKEPDQVAAELISALDQVRASHNRLAVVGRIHWGDEERTVVLGPYSTRSVEAARQVGQRLCTPAQHPGTGRFMLVSAFSTVQAAWEGLKPPDEAAEERLTRTIGDIHRWAPGLWAQEAHTGPVCHCGAHRGEPRPCPVHNPPK